MGELKNIIPLNSWFNHANQRPFVIAGPCSAENQKQMLETAYEIKKLNFVSVFRAGVWKPRTRPGSFEGLGKLGLELLQEVKNKTKLLITTEVATPEHLNLCLKHDVDIIWIGARTTSNPFSVQEIANEINKLNIDIPVLVKNPINPDLNLWIGAIERFYESGIRKIGAIHRGFYPFEKTNLRNIPKWEIPIELKQKYHNLPIITDPSHISGSREFIEEISQKALDLNFDGLMIETHNNPDVALSDANQQITPAKLFEIYKRLIVPVNIYSDRVLEQYREKIDSIDNQLIELLSQRMNIIKHIGKYKRDKNISIFQLRRWEQILKTRNLLGKELGLSEEFIKKILQIVHKESISLQSEILKNRNK